MIETARNQPMSKLISMQKTGTEFFFLLDISDSDSGVKVFKTLHIN